MRKCICLSRVSTGIQDLDQQTEKLIEAAHYQNYTDDEIIIIEDKESAVCKSEEERNGLNRLKECVEAGDVELVIVYELSRIARRADVLYSIRDFLISNKVQLQVLNPAFKLLKSDGTIDENSNILMGIFASLSENEGYLRKARFKRGKAKAMAEGKYILGSVLYGYKIVDYKIEIDEEAAEVVQGIFNDYVFNNKTAQDIVIDLMNRGIRKFASFNAGVQFVYKILHNCSYAGRLLSDRKFAKKEHKFDFQYPAIVSEEVFNKAISTFEKRKKYNKIHTKHEYLCRGLLFRRDMTPFNVSSSHNTYAAYSYDMDKSTKIEISANTMDNFIWERVVNRRMYRPVDYSAVAISDIKNKISSIDTQINNAESAIKEREEKIKRIEYRVIQGKLDYDTADEFESGIKKEIDEFNSSINALVSEKDRLNTKMYNLSNSSQEVTREALNDLSFDEKYKIVREDVKSILLVNGDKKSIDVIIGFDECNDPEIYKLYSHKKKYERLGN